MPSVFATLNPNSIHPGQSFDLFWAICQDAGQPVPIPASVRVSIDGVVLFPISGSPDAGAPERIHIDRGRLGTAADRFYRVGTSGFVNVVATATNIPGTISGRARYYLSSYGLSSYPVSFIGPPRDPVPSRFSSIDLRRANWKEPYTVALSIRNNTPIAVTPTLTLVEAENDRDGLGGLLPSTGAPTVVQTTTAPMLTPNAVTNVTFNLPAKEWPWLLSRVWVTNGPTFRGWTYWVDVSVQDELGNSTSFSSSPRITVGVSVSQQKINAHITAAGLFISAGIAAVAGAFWPPALIAAGALLVGAESFGAIALDPPEPDIDFATPVELRRTELPAALTQTNELSGFREWMDSLLLIGDLQEALYQLQAKILGAIISNEWQAVRNRLAEYVQLVRQMLGQRLRLRRSAPIAAKQLEAGISGEIVDEIILKLRTGGLLPEEEVAMTQVLPPDSSAMLATATDAMPPAGRGSMGSLLREATTTVARSAAATVEQAVTAYGDLSDQLQSKDLPPLPLLLKVDPSTK